MSQSPIILNNKNNCDGCRYIGDHSYRNGNSVPLYEIMTPSAFNQLIGYAKYINRDYGNVYYRGVNGLYDNVLPSLLRNRTRGIAQDLKDIIKKINEDSHLKESLHLFVTKRPRKHSDYIANNLHKRNNKYRIEGLLQHYIGKTRFIDVVDNHWVALWMGLHDFIECGEGGQFIRCKKRTVTISRILDTSSRNICTLSDAFQSTIYEYVILLAMPYSDKVPLWGVTEVDRLVEVDLRKALPSIFIRPHAQHAMLIRKRDIEEDAYDANYYDMASQVIGVLRIRTDLADKWLGNGDLVSQANLFPSPSVDAGYNSLLKNKVFDHNFQVKKYF